MDMNMHHGTPWLDQPVLLHSSRADTCKLTSSQCTYRKGHWRYWYQADHIYALAIVYFMVATIAVFTLSRLITKFTDSPTHSRPILGRFSSLTRYVEYRSFCFFNWVAPSLGVLLLLTAGIIYLTSLSLGPKPYYWPNTKTVSYGSSPPIATRTGWMALALLPFIIALSSKTNWITLLTGIPHERLQVYHQVGSWAMFVLALIHTFPFIVVHIRKGDMEMQWDTSVVYWTGVAALIPQTWLTFMSFKPIRDRYYELFKSTHFIAAMVFVIFFFLHCDFRLTSWDYFIATGVIYLTTLIYSQIRTYVLYGFSHRANLSILPGEILKVSIPVHQRIDSADGVGKKLRLTWTPGQHVFVRFLTLGVHALTAHPFSICSLPAVAVAKEDEKAEVVFFIKPHRGLTARLAALAQKSPSIYIPVMLDGPYGGLAISTFAKFDRVLIIAGGSGAGFTLPLIKDIIQRQHGEQGANAEASARKTKIQVVMSTRSQDTKAWYLTELEALSSTLETGILQRTIYVTGLALSSAATQTSHSDEKSATVEGNSKDVRSVSSLSAVNDGRPDVAKFVYDATSISGESVGIAVCGPETMCLEVRNEAAEAQTRVLSGKGPKEVYLHTEAFS